MHGEGRAPQLQYASHVRSFLECHSQCGFAKATRLGDTQQFLPGNSQLKMGAASADMTKKPASTSISIPGSCLVPIAQKSDGAN